METSSLTTTCIGPLYHHSSPNTTRYTAHSSTCVTLSQSDHIIYSCPVQLDNSSAQKYLNSVSPSSLLFPSPQPNHFSRHYTCHLILPLFFVELEHNAIHSTHQPLIFGTLPNSIKETSSPSLIKSRLSSLITTKIYSFRTVLNQLVILFIDIH